MESLKLPIAGTPGGGKTFLWLGQPLRLADCFPQGTFFTLIHSQQREDQFFLHSCILLSTKCIFVGPKTRSKKYHAWQICIFFAQFTLIHSEQQEDQFFFSQSYKGGPCPAQRHLLSGHASCATSDILFFA